MIYLRSPKPGNFLQRLDLDVVTRSPRNVFIDMLLYNTVMQSGRDNFLSPITLPVTELTAFCEVPKTYYITTPNDVICVYCKAHEEPINFIWDNNIAITVNVPTDSLVFLAVQGSQLTYDDDKLLYVRCIPNKYDAANVMFIDRYGQPQYMTAEKGKLAVSDSADNTYKSYQGQMTFSTNKQPLNAITLGDNNIHEEMKLFYAGFTDSPAYGLLIDNKLYECSVQDATIAADRFRRTFTLDATLQVDVETFDKLAIENPK